MASRTLSENQKRANASSGTEKRKNEKTDAPNSHKTESSSERERWTDPTGFQLYNSDYYPLAEGSFGLLERFEREIDWLFSDEGPYDLRTFAEQGHLNLPETHSSQKDPVQSEVDR